MKDVEEYHEGKEPDSSEDEKKKRPIIKSPLDLQRLKLEKLMKNPNKPVVIPELPKGKDFLLSVPSFVRNVMGSSAGAGSGEFHVYRHLRRKEYARQKFIQARSTREQLDEDYRNKLEQNRLESEAKTAKKRAKRLKRKQKLKERGGKKGKFQQKDNEIEDNKEDSNENSASETNSDHDDDNDDKNKETESEKIDLEKETNDLSNEEQNVKSKNTKENQDQVNEETEKDNDSVERCDLPENKTTDEIEIYENKSPPNCPEISETEDSSNENQKT